MAKINHEEYKILKGLDDQWKWIARDEDLSVYDDKPVKVHSIIPCWDISTAKNEWQRINRSLFQFIQWSDSEPYNITELIREYESEEKEVKKDIEFSEELQESIMRAFDVEATSKTIEALTGMTLEQIAEEAINGGIVPKQKLPVIPKFVAEYLDFAKSDVPLMRVMELANTRNEWPKWEKEYDWISANDETFARAWLDGYTIKKEPKYNVKFKVKSSFGTVGIFLYKKGDEVLAGDNFEVYYPKEDECRLTEQEIRGFQNGDILFEHFAVKAEGIDNA